MEVGEATFGVCPSETVRPQNPFLAPGKPGGSSQRAAGTLKEAATWRHTLGALLSESGWPAWPRSPHVARVPCLRSQSTFLLCSHLTITPAALLPLSALLGHLLPRAPPFRPQAAAAGLLGAGGQPCSRSLLR